MITCKSMYNFGLVTLLVAGCVQCVKIHEQMSDEEIGHFFRTRRDNVPEYEVVPVRHNLYKRSSTNLRLQFNAFGKEIDAYLEPSDSVLAGRNTPVWLASTKPNGTVEFTKLQDDIVGIVVGFFTSPIKLSSVVAINSRGERASFQGIVDGMEVRPLPERIQEAGRSRREVESTETSRTLLGARLHVIFKSAMTINENQYVKDLEKRFSKTRSFNETANSKSKRSTQDIVFPSIMIYTDFAQSKTTLNGLAYSDEITYQLAFWNAVDLRFRQVENPKIRLHIAGIIIALDRGATPFLHKYRTNNEVRIDEAFPHIEDYWTDMTNNSKVFPRAAYDIVVIMTDNYLKGDKRFRTTPQLEGVARIRGLCFRWHDVFIGIAAVRDMGGFGGVQAATHEVGHVIGLAHDGSTGDECDESHHYIMQPILIPGPNNLRWSPCSLKRLTQLMRDKSMDCVDEPAAYYPPGPSIPRLLPGYVAEPHKQCQGRGYSWACDTNPESCTAMKCYYTGLSGLLYGWWCQDTGPAAEGTTCSHGHKCINGVCQCMTDECIFNKTQ